MKVIKAFPPNWTAIAKVFPVKGKQGILYAYGDKLYNPSGISIPDWIMAHEQVHERQQGCNVQDWWHLYLVDTYFRKWQEIEAHRKEYKEYLRLHGWKEAPGYLDLISLRLSSPLYALGITLDEARSVILDG